MLQNENIESIRAPRLIPVWHDERPRRAGFVDDDSQSDTPRHPQPKTALSDAELLDLVQRQTFLYFWDGTHPSSGLARDSIGLHSDPKDDVVAVGGSGFGVMAIIVATERGWNTREDAVARLALMLDLERATCYHGYFPHFMNGGKGDSCAVRSPSVL